MIWFYKIKNMHVHWGYKKKYEKSKNVHIKYCVKKMR